jgi:hypothetical protein
MGGLQVEPVDEGAQAPLELRLAWRLNSSEDALKFLRRLVREHCQPAPRCAHADPATTLYLERPSLMFTAHRLSRAATLALIASATLLGSAATSAQERQIDFLWSPRAGLPTSFDIELKHRADGKLSGAIVPKAPRIRIVGQRSVLHAKAGNQGLQMRLGTLLQQRSASGLPVPLGQLSVQVDAPARPAGGGGGDGGDIIIFDIVDSAHPQASTGCCAQGDILVFDIVDSVTSVATRIRIDARPDQQLEGSAAHWQWFNRPGPGEPLIATIPVLLPGQTLNEVLEIRDARAPQVVPMKIQLRLQF